MTTRTKTKPRKFDSPSFFDATDDDLPQIIFQMVTEKWSVAKVLTALARHVEESAETWPDPEGLYGELPELKRQRFAARNRKALELIESILPAIREIGDLGD
jgi:hypothetical protein